MTIYSRVDKKQFKKEISFVVLLSYRKENQNWHLHFKQWDLFSVAFQI